MCCTSKEQQLVWYKAINVYDGKPADGGGDRSTSFFNENHDTNGLLSPTEMSGMVGDLGRNRTLSNSDPAMLNMTMPNLSGMSNEMETRARTSSRSNVMMIEDVELIAKAAAKAVKILDDENLQQKNVLSPGMVILLIVVLNVASYCVRNGSDQTYKVTLFFMNAFVLYVTFHQTGPKTSLSPRKGAAAHAAKAKKRKTDADRKMSATPENLQHSKSFAKPLPMGKTIQRAPPKSKSELEKQLQSHGPNTAEAVRAYAAAPTDSIKIQPHSYANTDAATFHLRVGPNYKKNKQKSPSAPALYDLYSMDFLYADTALKNVSDKFSIPSIPGITDISTGHSHIPPMLIINTWLPGVEPSMFAKNTDGETYSTVMVFVLSKDTLEQLKDIDKASPGVKLLSEWCRRSETDPDFRGRFKCMGIVEDIESTG